MTMTLFEQSNAYATQALRTLNQRDLEPLGADLPPSDAEREAALIAGIESVEEVFATLARSIDPEYGRHAAPAERWDLPSYAACQEFETHLRVEHLAEVAKAYVDAPISPAMPDAVTMLSIVDVQAALAAEFGPADAPRVITLPPSDFTDTTEFHAVEADYAETPDNGFRADEDRDEVFTRLADRWEGADMPEAWSARRTLRERLSDFFARLRHVDPVETYPCDGCGGQMDAEGEDRWLCAGCGNETARDDDE